MTYSHAAWSGGGVADPGVRAMKRVRSCWVNFQVCLAVESGKGTTRSPATQ